MPLTGSNMPISTKAHTSLEIFDEQITKAYGRAVIHNLAHAHAVKKGFNTVGVGALVVSRTIPATDVNENNEIIGRPDCMTRTNFDNMLDIERIKSLLWERGTNLKEFERFLNEKIIISKKDGVVVREVGEAATPSTQLNVLTNLFVVRNDKKVKKIKFVGKSGFGCRVIVFDGNSTQYMLYFVQDREFDNVLFLRLAPAILKDAAPHVLVYESLLVFNQTRKFSAVCIPHPLPAPVSGDKIYDKISFKGADIERRPILSFLKKAFPLEFYFPVGSSDRFKNKESIPYINAFLQDLCRLHYTYNALVAIAAALLFEVDAAVRDKMMDQLVAAPAGAGGGLSTTGTFRGGKAASSKNGYTRSNLDVAMAMIRALIGATLFPNSVGRVDPEFHRDVSVIHTFVAAAAEVVTLLYKKASASVDAATALSQLKTISLVDPDSIHTPDGELPDYYGHFIAIRLLSDLPVTTESDTTAPLDKKLGSPIQLMVRDVTPFTSISEFGESWNLRAFYSTYHRAFLNLAGWVSPDKKTYPVWMREYTIQKVLPGFRSDYFEDGDYSRVIPVRLCLDHKLEIAMHTFIRRVDGMSTKALKDRTPSKKR